MPKQDTIFTCSKCGAQFLKWQGRCSECGAWGTVAEEQKAENGTGKNNKSVFPDTALLIDLANIEGKNVIRAKLGIDEVDRVLGGGVVPGSLILLGGEPGIGKSTLVLQIAQKLAMGNGKEGKEGIEGEDGGEDVKQPLPDPPLKREGIKVVLYASGEESAEQIKLRMVRLGIKGENIKFLSETNVETICGAIQKYKPALAIIDSIQMLYSNDVDSECGSVNQIRASAAKLMGVAKQSGAASGGRDTLQCVSTAIIIIGHITKDGAVAGPKTLEHLVDTVLYLEGERFHTYRILRTVKNRFGSTNEIGIFEMSGAGLQEVKNPSALFMEEHNENLPGRVVACIIEGTRPFLIEIQALTATTTFGYPQRKVSGYDLNRLQLLLAVLQKRLGLNFSNKDVYLNIVGGFKIQEPSADLAVCMALISALKNQPLGAGTAAFGEVGLGGEIRSVSQMEKRINEATKLGFKNIICPKGKKTEKKGNVEAGTLEEAIGKIFGE
ncbi:MAG: DNA repair protein RadA [bacterium]